MPTNSPPSRSLHRPHRRPESLLRPSEEVAEAAAWIKAEGKDLHEIQTGIDSDLKPRSFTFTKLTADLAVDIKHDTKIVHNVEAYIPGQTNEYVIIGAHYDHLGLGDEHSLAPSQIGTIHPGADDNASGTAGVIELARYFSTQPKQKRGILFLTFAGEELGLLGSSWYVNHPLLPLENAVAMINMDMIGRIREGKVYVNGSGTGSTLAKLVDDIPAPAGLNLDLSEKLGYGGSDHMSFTIKSVPVLFFFSGLHGDYHKPTSDTPDKIDSADAAKLLDYVATVTTRLAADERRPPPISCANPNRKNSGGGGGGPPVMDRTSAACRISTKPSRRPLRRRPRRHPRRLRLVLRPVTFWSNSTERT